jgi:hypothetical protein
MMERPGADSEEKREPVGDIDIAVVDSLKVLDPRRPIREADIATARCGPDADGTGGSSASRSTSFQPNPPLPEGRFSPIRCSS